MLFFNTYKLKIFIAIVSIVTILYSQDKTFIDSSCGKPIFYTLAALEGAALAGYWTTTFISFGQSESTCTNEVTKITSFSFMGSYYFTCGLEKFVTLYQNLKLKKIGKERYRKKSAFQVALYSTSLLTGLSTVVVTVVDYLTGNKPYIATKSLMASTSILMTTQFIYDIHLFKKNCSLLTTDFEIKSNLLKLTPYVGFSYSKYLQFGIELLF